ncbi:sigma-54 interaction domain-containing protein [Porphyromonas macacae]|uniref:sigma-54 interaction domain-containing protein n=1 Tax=Porphyromonas macacae TaxID=28115 RepID=UPI0035A03D3A
MNVDIQSIKRRFGIIGNSPLLDRAIEVAVQVAPTDMSVLIMGESGVGKENFPKIIHQYSARKHQQYIAVNCGAIPEGTIDSELFGHRKGSFTGAVSDRKGYFEEASGGTIFLDEVGELPLPTQARLLRVLESGEFIPVGSSQPQTTDVRIVAATNVDLKEAVAKGRFREDLLFRLNTVPIVIPPLRNRADDIPLLFRKFAADSADRYQMPPLRLSDDARELIKRYRWPGNVRELKNITDRISILESERLIDASVLEHYLPEDAKMPLHPVLKGRSVDEHTFNSEREILYQVLFDMKHDMNELKALVNDLMQGKVPVQPAAKPSGELKDDSLSVGCEANPSLTPYVIYPSVSVRDRDASNDAGQTSDDLIYEEEPLSLADMERTMIKRALQRHEGKRKAAADELKISERTLYRKLKEYGMD